MTLCKIMACALLPADGDTLDDLRYAAMPPPAVPPPK